MTAPWDRVTVLFDAARRLDAELRPAFLDLACGPDTALREQVEGLLDGHVTGDGFLDPPHWPDLLGPTPVLLEPGTLLKNRYRVVEAIGGGGQALVYRAEDELLKRPVVLKVMRVEGRGSRLLKARFEREMKVLAALDHPGVVGILDVGELTDGSPYLVIQYVAGRSLRDVLNAGAPPRDRVAELVVQIATALEAAHAAGIAHGDLKPENVMVHEVDDTRPSVKLIDFGISKIATDDREPGTTMLLIAGTVRYMAPEQLEGKTCPASDTYALALMVCEMLSGHPDIRALPRTVSRAMRRTLEAALAYRPEDRPSDVAKWSAELARTIHARDRRKQPLVAALALGAAVVLGGVATQYFTRDALGDTERIVEKVGAFDPVTEGFQVAHDVSGQIVHNPTNTGFEGWRIVSASQGYYYRPFAAPQRRGALDRGWILSAEFRVESGAGGVVADFASDGARFDVFVHRDGDDEVAILLTQIVPEFRGLEIRQSPAGEYHRYELRYDPGTQTANLWVDGQRRLTGYRGHRQFQENNGFMLHGQVYNSTEGSVVFRSARFEINP